MEIREAKIEDAESIVSELYIPMAREIAGLIDNNIADGAEEEALEHRKDTLENEDGLCLIAENNKELVGLISVSIQERSPIFEETRYVKVHDLYVKEQYRNEGVAKKLFKNAEKWAANQGTNSIELNVDTPNKSAISFYQRQGFDEIRKKMRKTL